MKTYLASILRHAFTALAGLGGFLFANGLIEAGDVSQVNAAGGSMGAALAVISTAIAGRFLITLLGKVFSGGTGESVGTSTGTLPIVCITAAGILGCLPSCSTIVTKSTMPDGTVVEVTAKSSDAAAIKGACDLATELLPLLDHLAASKSGSVNTEIKTADPTL